MLFCYHYSIGLKILTRKFGHLHIFKGPFKRNAYHKLSDGFIPFERSPSNYFLQYCEFGAFAFLWRATFLASLFDSVQY
jgi:hypothetical protein